MIETWRDVPGYEGHYQVSDLGRVKALSRLVDIPNHRSGREVKKLFPERVLTPKRGAKARGGYYRRVQLYLGGVCWMPGVHVLVALAFIGPVPVGMEVNHKDGDPSNNVLTNIEYLTRSGNLLHARSALGHGRGADTRMAKLTEDDVRAIRAAYPGETFATLARRYGLKSRSTIAFIVQRKTWTHI